MGIPARRIDAAPNALRTPFLRPLLRRDWTAVRIENRGRGFLLQTVSQFAAGEVFQLFSLTVDSISGHAAF